MLAHKLTSLILLLNNILIILVLKEAKAITLACNPSVCVLSRQSKWHINIKVCFFAHLWRVQGKISCAIHWLWCFCKLFTIKTLVQSEKFVTWFDLRKAWANVTVCTYLFLHILVFEGHTYSVSQKKTLTDWFDYCMIGMNSPIDTFRICTKSVFCINHVATTVKTTEMWSEKHWSSFHNPLLCWKTFGSWNSRWFGSDWLRHRGYRGKRVPVMLWAFFYNPLLSLSVLGRAQTMPYCEVSSQDDFYCFCVKVEKTWNSTFLSYRKR